VPDHPRIEELRRRVQKDPASLAFAHLAEEFRRAGRFDEAIATCRAGLKVHPGYLSAKVTLGRALIETGDLDAAHEELQAVMSAAPDNLAAIRGLADIHQRRGQNQEALDYYQWALEFAGQDPDLARQVQDLKAAVRSPGPGPHAPPATTGSPAVPPATVPPAPAAGAATPAPPPGPVESAGAASPATPADGTQTGRQLEVFKRFLDAIAADRERRQGGR
jgi:tetratricopeptide (TPR) repeat protein